MNNCIGLLVPKIERTTQKRFIGPKSLNGTTNQINLSHRLANWRLSYLTLSFIAKEFLMAQLVV